MRIVGGKFKGRQIVTPAGRQTRPTSDRAREAIMNILLHASWAPPLQSARVIDLFAGSGALGLECLSRGASFCLFVDHSNEARAAIQSNIDAMELAPITRIQRRSAHSLGERPVHFDEGFDIACLDPPYGQGLVEPALNMLRSGDWLSDAAILVLETAKDEEIGLDGWSIHDERTYGAASIRFISRSADA